jgi:hypothetical protein
MEIANNAARSYLITDSEDGRRIHRAVIFVVLSVTKIVTSGRWWLAS